jgi:hypothetical protein
VSSEKSPEEVYQDVLELFKSDVVGDSEVAEQKKKLPFEGENIIFVLGMSGYSAAL